MRTRIILPLASLTAVAFFVSCQTGNFSRFDADRDDSLNFDEFSAATTGRGPSDPAAAFIAADSDRDGALSDSEYQVYVSTYAGR